MIPEQNKQDIIKAVRIAVSMFCIGTRNFEMHMKWAVDGREVPWYSDSDIDKHDFDSMKVAIYKFMRDNQDEFLSEDNKLMKHHGAVRVYWKSGGDSEAVIYKTQTGERMLCCANWISGPVSLKEQIYSIKSIEKLVP